MIVTFWLSALGVIYSYLVYPLLLNLIPARKEIFGLSTELRSLAVIVAVHNEEARIREKIEDTLAQGYPAELLEIVVVSDASDDRTDEIVSGFVDKGVTLVRQDTRGGKEAAQLLGIRHSSAEHLVFSDVATRIAPGSLQIISRLLISHGIGAVSSEDVFEEADGSGEGLYVRYEMTLRRLESERAGLVGLSGSFFGARRAVCDPWPVNIPSDFAVALNSVRLGLRAISTPDVVGIYGDLRSPRDEFSRKRRTVLRGMTALAQHKEALALTRMPLFVFQVWSHKIMRWAVPWFLLMLAIVTISLLDTGRVFLLAGYLQVLLYGSFLLGALAPRLRQMALVRIAYYFVQVNLAIAIALLDFLRGRRVVTWNPSKR